MSAVAPDPRRLTGIAPEAYQHPADRAATAALRRIPHFDKVIRRLMGLGAERVIRSQLLGGAVLLGERQLPSVWGLHDAAFMALDVRPTPDLYLMHSPAANAWTVGTQKPIVAVHSELIELLEPAALLAVFGHEAAHVHCAHNLYGTAMKVLAELTSSAINSSLAGIPIRAIRLALLEWSRAAELSCDRAAALVSESPTAVCGALLAMTAGAGARHLNLDAFIEQGLAYESGDILDRSHRRVAHLLHTHPLPIRRVRLLMDWVRSGEYDRILAGQYPRRGDAVPVVESSPGAALEAYVEQMNELAADATPSVASLEEWLDDETI